MKRFLTILLLVSFANCFSAEQNEISQNTALSLLATPLGNINDMQEYGEFNDFDDSSDDEISPYLEEFYHWRSRYYDAGNLKAAQRAKERQKAIFGLKELYFRATQDGEQTVATAVAKFLKRITANN